MKKALFKKLFILLLVIFFTLPAFATNKTYNLDELNMTIDIPDEYITFTRVINENDPNLKIIGTTAEALTSQYKSSNIFLNSINMEPLYEIVITKIEFSGTKKILNFNQYSDSALNKTAEEILNSKEMKNADRTNLNYLIYKHNQANFIVINFWQIINSNKVYGCQYYTIYNEQAINITVHSYNGTISDELRQIQKTIIDSVNFTKTIKKNNSFFYNLGHLFGNVIGMTVFGGIIGGIVGLIIAIRNNNKRKKEI